MSDSAHTCWDKQKNYCRTKNSLFLMKFIFLMIVAKTAQEFKVQGTKYFFELLIC